VEFFNTCPESQKDETIFVRIGEKIIVVDKHDITYTFKISNIGWRTKVG